MKKTVLILLVLGALFAGCKKDTDPTVNITQTDLNLINTQLRGTWLFPTETLNVVDNSGKALLPSKTYASSAFQFDGISNVSIMPDINTVEKGTYSLTTSGGFIYMTVLTPDGNTTIYKILLLNDKTLKIYAIQPYLFYNGDTPVIANAEINTVFKKQDAADISGSLVNITVVSDSLFDVNVGTVRNGDTVLLGSQLKVAKQYNFAYQAKQGDHLFIDVLGSVDKTTFSAYYNGLPLSGDYSAIDGEIQTTTGWNIP